MTLGVWGEEVSRHSTESVTLAETKTEVSIWECYEILNKFIVESDPKLDVLQIELLLQTAEAIRTYYPAEDFALIALTNCLTIQWCCVGGLLMISRMNYLYYRSNISTGVYFLINLLFTTSYIRSLAQNFVLSFITSEIWFHHGFFDAVRQADSILWSSE